MASLAAVEESRLHGDLYSEQDVQTKVVVPYLAAAGYRETTRDVRISYNRPVVARQGREERTIFADVVVDVAERPVIVVDSKSPRHYLGDNDREQVISYARLMGTIAPYAALCNGHSWRVYDSVTKQQIAKLPTYSEVKMILRDEEQLSERKRLSLVHQANRTLLAIDSARELSRLMHRCHDIIRNLKGYDPTKAFDELSKLLFAKMYEEREIDDGNRKINRFTLAEVGRVGVDIIQNLWRDTVKSKRYRDVFSDEDANDQIDLPPEAIDKIVGILEDKSLGKTDLDVKGVAFEEFLSATYRGGGLGQYFTPREVVNFMVDLVNPRIGNTVVDPSCGSGGFLIRVYDVVRDKILTSDLAPRTQREKEKELATSCLAGIDWERRAARTCKMNMIIHGDGHAGVYQGNALDIEEITEKVKDRKRYEPTAPAIDDESFDIVLTNPPFGAKDDQERILTHYEIAQGTKSQKREVLLIERCIRLLRPGGRMAIVIPEGILSNKNDKRIRNYIRANCIVRAVIRLPQDAFKMSEGAACTSILYVVKKDESNPSLTSQGDIFFARAAYVGISPSGSPIDQNDLPAIREQFWRFDRGEWDGIEIRATDSSDLVEFIREAPVQHGDWLEPEVNRTSLLYDRLSYVLREPQISNRFSYTYNHPKYYRVMAALDEMPVDVKTLDSLCVDGYPIRGTTPKEQSVEGIPILKVRNVTGNGISMETDYAPNTEEIRAECKRGMVSTGDLLITSTGEGTIGRIDPYLFYEEAIADTHVTICRLAIGVNREYVEEFLKSEFGQIQMLRNVIGSTGQTELLINDIKGLRIPLPSRETQADIVRDMKRARERSRECASGANYLRGRGAEIVAAARTRMLDALCGHPASEPVESAELPNSAATGDLETRFKAHAEVWRRQTRHMSSVAKMITHPSYQAIIAMGDLAVPLLLMELRDRPDHWLVALRTLTDQDPAKPGSTFGEAVEAWLSWGRERKFLH